MVFHSLIKGFKKGWIFVIDLTGLKKILHKGKISL